MKPYPLELRQRLVEAVDQQCGTIEEIARIFQVHSSYIYKLLRQRREKNDLAPLPHGGGASAKLAAEERRVLAELVAAQPDATLDELRQGIEKKKRVRVSLSTIWRWLAELALTRKKSLGGPVKRTRSSGRRLPPNSPRCPRRA
jgi:transposase